MAYNTVLHVIPLNDHIEHLRSKKCPCGPFLDNSEALDIYVHHALDGRESLERSGFPVKGKQWISEEVRADD